jgi:hypothetical protein
MPLVSRAVAMIIVGVVEPVTGSKKQAGNNKNRGESKQNGFDIHGLLKSRLLENADIKHQLVDAV